MSLQRPVQLTQEISQSWFSYPPAKPDNKVLSMETKHTMTKIKVEATQITDFTPCTLISVQCAYKHRENYGLSMEGNRRKSSFSKKKSHSIKPALIPTDVSGAKIEAIASAKTWYHLSVEQKTRGYRMWNMITWTTARSPSTSRTWPRLRVPSPRRRLTISWYLGPCHNQQPSLYQSSYL